MLVIAALDRLFEPSRMNVQVQLDKLANTMETKMTQNIALMFQREVSN